MFRNRLNLQEIPQAVNDYVNGPAARECLHCGDFFTGGGELWGCTGRTDGSRLHELRTANLYQVEFSGRERQMIDSPARCSGCGQCYESPTTGKLMDDCSLCGGTLVHLEEAAAAELSAALDDVWDSVTRLLVDAAQSIDLAAGLLRDSAPEPVQSRLVPSLLLELSRLKGLRNQVGEAFRGAALDAAIIAGSCECEGVLEHTCGRRAGAGSVDDKIHYHSPELTSAEDSPDPVAEARSSSSAS